MNLKEILAKIKTLLGADAPAETIALLADADRQASDILDTLGSANKESASHKARIRELEASIEDQKSELVAATSPERQAELDRLKKIEIDYIAREKAEQDKLVASWQEKAKIFDIKDPDPLHGQLEKIKASFVFGEDITPEAARANLEKFALLEAAGALNPPAKQPSDYGMADTGTGSTMSGADAIIALSKT